MQFSFEIFGWYSAFAVPCIMMLGVSSPSDPETMTTLEVLKRMQTIGPRARPVKPSAEGRWFRPYQQWWHDGMQRQFRALQTELSSRDLHPNGKAPLGGADSPFQLLEILSMNANCDKAVIEECVEKYLELSKGEKYDLQPNGKIVIASSRISRSKAKKVGRQRCKK